MAAEAEVFVSIAMPALNEERHIAQAIASVIPRSGKLRYELLLVDGGSSDDTVEIVKGLSSTNPHIRILLNHKKIQAAAMNLAAKEADPRSRYIVRADCHLQYPEGFVERCIDGLVNRRVASVVVPMHTVGSTCMQRAIAAAQNSRMGNGGSAHRNPGRSGFVEHGHHAAFDRAVFLELGGYDENFSHNEDAEFDKRLVQSGHHIYLDGDAIVTYFPRATLGSLMRQYFYYGAGRARTILKHRARPQLRQMAPVAVLLACSVSLLLALLDLRFLAIPLAYMLACLAWGVGLAIRRRDACLTLAGAAAVVMHLSWGSGFVSRALKSLLHPSRDESAVMKLG